MIITISRTEDNDILSVEFVINDTSSVKRFVHRSIGFQEIGQIQNLVVRTMRQVNDRKLIFVTETGKKEYPVNINVSNYTMIVDGNLSFIDVFAYHIQKSLSQSAVYSVANSNDIINQLVGETNEIISHSDGTTTEPQRPFEAPETMDAPQEKAPVLFGEQALERIRQIRKNRR